MISVNLDKVQRNGATLAESVLAWKDISKNYRDRGAEGKEREMLAAVETRYNKSVSPVFYVAFSLHPASSKEDLSEAEWASAMDWVEKERPSCFELYVEFIGGNKTKLRICLS